MASRGRAKWRVLGGLSALVVAGCPSSTLLVPDAAELPTPAPAAADAVAARALDRLDEVLAAARRLVGGRDVRVGGRSFRSDCSGLVRGAFSVLDIDVMGLSPATANPNGVAMIHRYFEAFGENHGGLLPSPGDVVYFDNTWDRNGNGRLDDPLTHVGLVDEVRPDGQFFVIHRSSRGVVRDPMNLLRPHDHLDGEGRECNARLRLKHRRDPPDTPRLMSELFAGFGTLRAVDPLPASAPYDDVGTDDLPPPPLPDEP
jgi:cell wall-associated NlpC family hydrolase